MKSVTKERVKVERAVWFGSGVSDKSADIVDPLIFAKCQGEMRIISFIDQPEVIKKILQHLSLWEESYAPPERDPPIKEITFDPSYSQLI